MLRIKEIMAEKKISNVKLAEMLQVTPQYVSEVVKEKKRLSINKLQRLSQVLEVPLPALFEGYSPDGKKTKSNEIICPCCGHVLSLNKVE